LREKEYLKARYAAILASLGMILMLASGLLVTPLLALAAYPNEAGDAWAFLVPAAVMGFIGLGLWRFFRPSTTVTLSVQEGGVIVMAAWLLVVLFSAVPLMPLAGLDFTEAYFEAMSGWTTTGLSLVDLTQAGRLVLLWRGIMQLAGGAGLAILMMSAVVGPVGVGISSAEGRADQLAPHVKQSARLVLMIYGAYALVGALAYVLSGMTVFDALNHSFAAISTGGFGTRPESIGYWDSPAVEAVSIVLMILGNLSFVTAWFLWRGKFKAVFRNGEVRLMAFLIPVSGAVVFLLTTAGLYPQLSKAARVAFFETISALTTTGFSTVSYTNWNGLGILVMILLMLIGGGTCSTAGGIKQFRVHLMWKLLVWEIRRALLPPSAVLERPLWEGEKVVYVDDGRVRQLMVFVFLYLLTYAVGVLILCGYGYSLKDSLFEYASSIGTVGLTIGITTTSMPDVAIWSETAAMFLGRLELLVVFVSAIKLARDSGRLLKPATSAAVLAANRR
jgi:trk system potassium uptake protein TrkH